MAALDRMRAAGTSLKLGSLQRWVHACALDTIHAYDPVALRVLDSIIRVSNVAELCAQLRKTTAGAGAGAGAGAAASASASAFASASAAAAAPGAAPARSLPPPTHPGGGGTLVKHSPWPVSSLPVGPDADPADADVCAAATAAGAAFQIVAHERAAERRPQNKFDLSIVTSPPGVIAWDPDAAITRVDMVGPLVPGFACTAASLLT